MVTAGASATDPPLVIFDLCDTLYDENTTVGFIRHYQSLHQDRRLGRILRRWLSRASPYFLLGAIAYRLLRKDLARQRIIAALAGHSRTQLTDAAADYASNILPSRANAVVHGRLNAHLAAGDRVMLLSSSLDLVVTEVASVLGVDYRASTLGFDGDICTGRLERDLTGAKSAAIRHLIDTATEICVYTDNRSDKDLVDIADRATIIVPRGSRVVHWGGSDCDYLRL